MNFEELYQEITELNQHEPKDLATKMIKFQEEYGELCAEILKFKGETYKPYNREDLRGEMADALQCLLSIYETLSRETGISLEEVGSKMTEKNAKWRATIQTYTKLQNLKTNS